jgi:hypothetical protein
VAQEEGLGLIAGLAGLVEWGDDKMVCMTCQRPLLRAPNSSSRWGQFLFSAVVKYALLEWKEGMHVMLAGVERSAIPSLAISPRVFQWHVGPAFGVSASPSKFKVPMKLN